MLSLLKNKKGFSLLELVLAIAIFSLGSVVIALLLIDTNTSARLNLERTEALFYAKEGVEATRSIRDNNWTNLVDGDHGLVSGVGGWSFSGTSDLIDSKYTRVVNISSNSTTTKNIRVTIGWDFTPARHINVVLDTILTKWK